MMAEGNTSVVATVEDLNTLLLNQTFLEVRPELAITYIFMLSTALTVGTVGNLIIIGVCAVTRNKHSVGNEFLINLAIADLYITAVVDPLCILGVSHGRNYFTRRPILCQMIACLCLSACICAFFSLSLVTLNRYIYICHNKIFKTVFTQAKIIMMCIMAWMLAFLVESPNFYGWGGHGYDMKQLQCMWMRTASYSYTLLVAIGLIGTPLLMMTAAYVMIFLTIRNSKAKVFAQNMIGATKGDKKELKETIKSAKSLFVVVTAFLICWLPYTFTIVFDFEDNMHVNLHVWVTFLAHLHSALNFPIFLLTNSNFRQGCLTLLRLFWRGQKSSLSPATSSIKSNSKPELQVNASSEDIQ